MAFTILTLGLRNLRLFYVIAQSDVKKHMGKRNHREGALKMRWPFIVTKPEKVSQLLWYPM
ncbi:MAG: hypothetical protein C6W56_14640 [Caldibacillus debilis]|nr:MAG: hypothetical protein C6W56_14640 [Caldibacillus debilis]